MATEILPIPEDDLQEVIDIIRTGIVHTKNVSTSVKENLEQWCDEEEEYLKDDF